MNDVVVGKGNLDSKGVYAAKDFKKDEVIIYYELIPITEDEFKKLSASEKNFVHSHWGQLYLYSEPERYVNHSDNPNTRQDLLHKTDVALRDISRGEMITCDHTKDDVG